MAISVSCSTSNAYCASFSKQKSRGWHWYEDRKQEEATSKNDQIESTKLTPTEQIEQIKKDAEHKLNTALIQPTEKNVIAYIKAQERIGDKSEKFSKVWQQVIYKNPNLDRTIKHPVSNNALHIARSEELNKKRQKIKNLSKEYGLMYFFRGDCKYCQGFASVVQNFAQTYNWELMPIQIGEVGSAAFPNANHDNGISQKLGITSVPALIAVHPKTGDMVPLAFGYVSESEIEDRVNVLISKKVESK